MLSRKMNLYSLLFLLNVSLIFAVSESDSSDNTDSVYVDVLETRKLDLSYVMIDGASMSYADSIDEENHIRAVFPIADGSDGFALRNAGYYQSTDDDIDDISQLLRKIEVSSLLSSDVERTVGRVPEGWFENYNDPDVHGYSLALIGVGSTDVSSVLVEEDLHDFITIHELAHSIGGLCDEYSQSDWQDDEYLANVFFNYCPNGDDSDISGRQFDTDCAPNGCPVTTYGLVSRELLGLEQYDKVTLNNIMGSLSGHHLGWISTDSYNQLLDKFTQDRKSVQNAILVSGYINKVTDSVQLSTSYELGSRQIFERNYSSQGNYSLIAKNSTNDIIFSFNFTPVFELTTSGGDNVELNTTYFVFALNNTINITRIEIKKDQIVEAYIDRSQNVPNVQVLNPIGGENYSGQLFNVSWSATDADSDNLTYAVLLSLDNGSIYTTIVSDYNDTFISVNGSDFVYSTECRFKVVVSDGINTGYNYSSTFISGLKVPPPSIIITNSTGEDVVRFTVDGDLYIRGTLYQSSSQSRTINEEWIISKNSDDQMIVSLDSGNLYLDGSLYENQTITNTNDSLIVVDNGYGQVVSYLDSVGNLYLSGEAFTNTEP